MYSNSVQNMHMQHLAEKQLKATGKYQIKGLEMACEMYFARNVTEENAGRLARLADMYDARCLQHELEQFVTLHNKSCV